MNGNGSGSPARSPKPSCSTSGPKQLGQQNTVSGHKLLQVASVSLKNYHKYYICLTKYVYIAIHAIFKILLEYIVIYRILQKRDVRQKEIVQSQVVHQLVSNNKCTPNKEVDFNYRKQKPS